MGDGGNYGITPAEAVLLNGQNRNDGDWGNGGFMWVFFLFFLLAWGGNGFFGNNGYGQQAAWQNGALTRADLQEGFNFNELQRGIQGIQNGLCDGFYAQAQQVNGLNVNMLQGFNSVGAQLAQLGYQQQSCCCETNRNIDRVSYENARNTCDIMQNQDRNTQRIIDTLTANQIQDLRDQLQTANMQLSQQAQSANLLAELRPCAKPAWITCSPYQAMPIPQWNNGCCNNGNGFVA